MSYRIVDRKPRQFTLSPSFLEQFQGKQPKWGFGGLGYFTYKRTYSRDLPGGGTEEWWQTVQRVVEGTYNIQKVHCRSLGLPWSEPKAQQSAQDMFQRMWDFKFLPPGRGLWMMGTDFVDQKGSAGLNNCGFTSTENIKEDFAAPFCFLMDMSMLGVGVGGDTKGAGKVVIRTPKLSSPDNPFVVDDSREGWVNLISVILRSFAGKGVMPTVIDFRKVRSRGEPIRSFGGIASGPKPLCDLVRNLTKLLMPEGVHFYWTDTGTDDSGGVMTFMIPGTEGWDDDPLETVTNKGEPYKITSAQIVDIFNFIGKAVVAGGVRRTAEIMFGEPDDLDFINLKQDKEALYDRRWASNNSIFGTVGMDYSDVAEKIAVNGEPGIIWLDNIRKFSRMGDPPDHKDYRAMGSNPCSEQSLESYELCCLVESFPAHHDSLEDYMATLKKAYLYAKTVTLVPTHDPRTNAVMMRNRRIGCSMSGIVQAMNKLGRRQFLDWCDGGYGYIQKLDKSYSDWLCVPRSIKTTSVKPSGTVSLLAGATPGIHFPHSAFYIRNVRVSDTSPLIAACKAAGYPVEKDSYAPDTSVISFPVAEEHFTKGKEDISIWEQFSNAAAMQRHWADNQVSVTVTFRDKPSIRVQDEDGHQSWQQVAKTLLNAELHVAKVLMATSEEVKPSTRPVLDDQEQPTVKPSERDQIAACLEVYETQLKSVSLLPLGDDHGYTQAPYIKITKDEYETMRARITTLDLSDSVHEVTERFCTNDSCTL